jgi:hypothetical protein
VTAPRHRPAGVLFNVFLDLCAEDLVLQAGGAHGQAPRRRFCGSVATCLQPFSADFSMSGRSGPTGASK